MPQGAVLKGHLAIVRLLLKAGAAPDARYSAGDWTALSMAADLGHAEIVQRLLRAGADVNWRSSGDGTNALICAAWQVGPKRVLRPFFVRAGRR